MTVLIEALFAETPLVSRTVADVFPAGVPRTETDLKIMKAEIVLFACVDTPLTCDISERGCVSLIPVQVRSTSLAWIRSRMV